MVVLDVGTYTVCYSILAAATNPDARVFAFGPHPRIAARLGRNLDPCGYSDGIRHERSPLATEERRNLVPNGYALPKAMCSGMRKLSVA
jgi:hypothetical protein